MKSLQLAALGLLMAGCVVAVKSSNPPPDPGPPPSSPPVHHVDKPSPWPPGAPPVPAGQPWYHDKLELKYDAALDDCYDASRKALGFMKFTESDQNKKTGVMTAQAGSIWVRCSMYRRSHHTFLTFYFRVHGHRADARMPGDFARKCHEFVAKEVKETGRKTD